jgi:hypothetical protein
MKSILRLAAVVVSACVLSGCATRSNKVQTSEAAKHKGCPDEDPFCAESGGKAVEDEAPSKSKSAAAESASSSGESGPSTSAPTPGKSPESATDEIVVIKVSKQAPPADKDSKAKDGKDKDAKAAAAKKPAPKPGKEEAGKTAASVVLYPKGLTWGMGAEQIAKLYDRIFEAQYTELYKRTPIGPQTEALDAEREEKKRLLRQNKLIFGNMPTGMDNTALKSEFTYQNNESMTKLDFGNGLVRNFFFFGDRLWKIYDEHTLGKSPIGANWESAILYVSDKLGSKPKLLEAGGGRDFQQAEWSDGTTLVRLVNRDYQQVVGVVFLEESVQKQLPSLRKNRKADATAVDASVAAATRPREPSPAEKKATKAGAKKK